MVPQVAKKDRSVNLLPDIFALTTTFKGNMSFTDRARRPFLLLIFSIGLSFDLHATRVIHVLVALADNDHQQGLKVSAALGNGNDPASNILWGAGFGVRSHFDWAPEWERMECRKPDVPYILDRAVWKHRDSTIYLVADAYAGDHLLRATQDLLLYSSGDAESLIGLGGKVLPIGGGADLIVYMGHNGLMDHKIEKVYRPVNDRKREVMILASMSRGFFANPIRATEATPILWTTGLLIPEAYILREALIGWVVREKSDRCAERAAEVYGRNKNVSLQNARKLFVSSW
jgi:hypothetical protein